MPVALTPAQARVIFLAAQRLADPGWAAGTPGAVRRAVEHLGYVQIDAINVVERSHHHILFNRIPGYRQGHLRDAQSVDRTVFEYWTHALAYVPAADFRYFVPAMRAFGRDPGRRFATVDPAQLRGLLRRIKDDGPLSIRDIEDDRPVEKDHPWASRKPSKRALQLAFFRGDLTISARAGMVKTYELTDRHFGWARRPAAATERQVDRYLLDRALRAQGIVSLDSVCHLDAGRKPSMLRVIEESVRAGRLVSVHVAGHDRVGHWVAPDALDSRPEPTDAIHILSPFDPVVIQRKRLRLLFGYDHRFEAYVPAAQRVLGYFALPVLCGDRIVAAIDLKADRRTRTLVIQGWTDVVAPDPGLKARIEEGLDAFGRFQFSDLAA